MPNYKTFRLQTEGISSMLGFVSICYLNFGRTISHTAAQTYNASRNYTVVHPTIVLSNTSSPCRSTCQGTPFAAPTASLECLLHVPNSYLFKTAPEVLDTEKAFATTNIDLKGSSTTLRRTALEIKLEKKIAGAKATANSEGQSIINDDETVREQQYDKGICQGIQVKIATLGSVTTAEIKSMVDHEIVDYQASHLFPLLCKQVDAKITDASETGRVPINRAIRMDLNTAIVKAVEATPMHKRANSAILRAARRTFESESFFREISQQIVNTKLWSSCSPLTSNAMSTKPCMTGELRQIR